ncbi:hypothetical protein BvCms854_00118 [Escherichia coli]|nr:Uncharacterised protein [Escherichia coli]SQY61837.1 Uncharacterised protein [Escherichia coli]GCN39601.1 hypothetical protein BvCms854_00118 [Escherichia coli]GCS76154.1 hypothetical protein HmCmsJML018_03968 [Escherichia coli]GCW43677.1 hypothetical protein HmCmsJML080_03135 [Escherichia coli]
MFKAGDDAVQGAQGCLHRHSLYRRCRQAECAVLHQHQLRRDGFIGTGKLNVVAERGTQLFAAFEGQHIHRTLQAADFEFVVRVVKNKYVHDGLYYFILYT